MNIETLDALWKNRHQSEDLHDLTRLLEAYSRESDDQALRYEVDWRRSRVWHFTAMHHQEKGERREAHTHFERGTDAAQWTVGNERIEGRFWWAVNELEVGRMGGKWSAFWALRGTKPQLETAAKLDETFHFAGPLRVLGRIAHLAPPRIGGGLGVAKGYFERALEIVDNSTTRLYYAELLRDLADTSAAKKQLEALLAAPDDEDWRWEQERDRGKARELIGTLNH